MVNKKFLCLDVGERRVGLAIGDSETRFAWPQGAADADKPDLLRQIIKDQKITDIVIGRPRNQQGSRTNQTASVEFFVDMVVKPLGLPVHWQDESVTSVIAEERLQSRTKNYTKSDIDAEAATIILQDFLEDYERHN